MVSFKFWHGLWILSCLMCWEVPPQAWIIDIRNKKGKQPFHLRAKYTEIRMTQVVSAAYWVLGAQSPDIISRCSDR